MIWRLFTFIANVVLVGGKDIYVGSYGAFMNGENSVDCALSNTKSVV